MSNQQDERRMIGLSAMLNYLNRQPRGVSDQLRSELMTRRSFCKAASLSAFALLDPRKAAAQRRVPQVGLVQDATTAGFSQAVLRGIENLGLSEGIDFKLSVITVDPRTFRADLRKVLELDLTVLAVDAGTLGAQITKDEARNLPFVFLIGGDPVQAGLTTSVSRPGGNYTGVSLQAGMLNAKRLELLNQVASVETIIGVVLNGKNPNHAHELSDLLDACRTSSQSVSVKTISSPADLQRSIEELGADNIRRLIIFTDPLLNSQSTLMGKLCLEYGILAISGYEQFVKSGGLVSYGPDYVKGRVDMGEYVGRILKGSKPGDLPILFPSHFNLHLNARSARMMGIELPAPLLMSATQVIE